MSKFKVTRIARREVIDWKGDESRGFCVSISFYQPLIALLVDTCTEGLFPGGADYLSGGKAVPVHTYGFASSRFLKDSRRAGTVLSRGSIGKDSCMPWWDV